MPVATQTLPEFYAAKLRQPFPDSLRHGGHVAVFRLEEFATDTELALTYGRPDFYKIMLGTGHATYYQDGRAEQLAPGQPALIFTGAQVPHAWQVHSLPYCGYCCVFTEDFLPTHTHLKATDWPVFQPDQQSFFRLTEEKAGPFGALFEKMLSEQASAYVYKYELLFHYVMACVYEALKLHPGPEPRGGSAATRLSTAFFTLLARQFPVVSPTQRLELRTVQAFADQLAVHVNHLNRSLKAVTGKTTSQLLAQRVAQEARALLLHTDWPVSAIGHALGFDEQTHFTHFFKQHAHCTPSALRQG